MSRLCCLCLAAILLAAADAVAALALQVKTSAVWSVRHKNSGAIGVGRGVNLTGAVAPDGSAYVTKTMGADSHVGGVIYKATIDDKITGLMVQVGLSNVQVSLGSKAASVGDRINIQDATGVWQPAPAAAANVYYYALEAGTAGSLIWAAPINSRPL